MPETGSVFIAGGDNWVTATNSTNNQGNNNSNVFQSKPGGDAQHADPDRIDEPRALVLLLNGLVNGEIYIQGGNGGGDFPEVRQSNGNFRLLTGASTSGSDANLSAQFPCSGRAGIRV
jgi:hypothetical protein